MTAPGDEFTALKTTAGDRDPVRLRYIESLLQRADARGGRLGEILRARASEAMDQYRQQAEKPAPDLRAKRDNLPLRELNRLLESLREEQDDPHVAPLEQALRQQEFELVDAIAGQSAPGHSPQARHQELKAARRFHSAMVKLNADKVVTQALEEVPAEAGPLNPQRLATRSLATMRDLSPHYLSRFVSYVDTLFWLEQAQKVRKR
ncbi:DUF2894 domain-containing protein [Pseudohalioglobus lutimaris]|uniref:DUF2894 domain-containing protein n=1 Tax=Pseudohalioglobus lutimaris TaxID=1737061 RepID=A0A2N5X646_9GAMM|nr:DUF2894 domain-containing protein [Pseudohalioglobus lutimaris]PLW69965.1 hypothetical protein C0039_05455 [Pseudohalioglobus lutimaris]